MLPGIVERAIEKMNQHARALYVAQKFIAQARAEVGALDETGNIGEDKVAIVNDRDA
jgi:hypothetical protein